ncbi:MAG: DNA repair protein RadA, partial [Vampirovibrio sp.]|nr:DNA repair protein RadA [Vampirovibrio sp.]
MAKEKISYECDACGYISPTHLGKCPNCAQWNSFIEVKEVKLSKDSKRQSVSEALGISSEARLLSEVTQESTHRVSSGFPELDRVLGGGIIPGSYVLVGGDPGIGKSTLMLQMADRYGNTDQKVMYVAGEESPQQIKSRSARLGVSGERILVLPETDIHRAIETIHHQKPALVIVDSVQAMYSPQLAGTPGSIGQIKACASLLLETAKSLGITIFLIGHVTKEGSVSGPKLLEHTVDAVLYFEGEKYHNLRVLRSVKNRFGNTDEIGVFEMLAGGLGEVSNPSERFLSESSYQNLPGSVIVATLEGTRPMLVELQALVGQSAYATPRRIANGVASSRLHQIVAVLERRLGLDFSRQDIYVN